MLGNFEDGLKLWSDRLILNIVAREEGVWVSWMKFLFVSQNEGFSINR